MSDIHIHTTEDVNPGVRGQTRKSWRDETSLRGVLLRLADEHPDASRDTLKELFRAKVEMSEMLIDEAVVYAFDNHFKALHKAKPHAAGQPHSSEPEAETASAEGEQPQPLAVVTEPPKPEASTAEPPKPARPRPSPEEAAAAKAAKEAAVAAMLDRVKDLVLLDLVLPNTGKKLRDSTGEECEQAGGWFTAVGKRVGKDGIVGQVASEAELRALRDQA